MSFSKASMSSIDFFGGACSQRLKSVESLVSNKHLIMFACPVTNHACQASKREIGNSAESFSKVGTGS